MVMIYFSLLFSAPPEKPIIYDTIGDPVNLILGPYKIGQTLRVKCEVVGGKPIPQVTWWKDHKMVDDTIDEVFDYKVTNELILVNLTKLDQNSLLTCKTSNHVTQGDLMTSVKLQMTCKDIEK